MPREDFVARWLPVAVGLAVLGAGLAYVISLCVSETAGVLVFPLDDPYIHMAMAKNLGLHGVYGISRHAFTSSSSSPLWTLLLAGVYWLTGVSVLAPLVLNVVFAATLVIAVDLCLKKYLVAPLARSLSLLAVVGLVPLPTLALLSQEHVLHALLALLFANQVGEAMLRPRTSRTGEGRRHERVLLLLLPAALVMTRYESLALVLVACLLLLGGGRSRTAIAVAAAGALPVLAFGAWSIGQGWFLLPNPIVLKAQPPEGHDVSLLTRLPLAAGWSKLAATPHLIVLVLMVTAGWYFLWRNSRPAWSPPAVVCALYVPTTILHLQYGQLGWLYRYEAYLVALGVFALTLVLTRDDGSPGALEVGRGLHRAPGIILALLVLVPLVDRAQDALRDTPGAARNIYQQQYQMGRFLAQFYAGQTVALNDIGAASYMSDIDTVDLWGLADVEVADARRRGRFTTEWIEGYARRRGVKVALLYKPWFTQYGGLPARWVKVGHWRVGGNVVLGGETVQFYAADPGEADRLAKNLRAFSPLLPHEVEAVVSYPRTEG